MQIDGFRRFLPYTGILGAIALIAAIILSGSVPSEDASAAKIIEYYSNDSFKGFLANFVFLNLFAAMTLFFVTELRATLRSGEAGESIYSSLAFAGGIALAVAISVGGLTSVAAFSAGDSGFAAATVALGVLAGYSYVPWMIGGAALFLAVGIGGLKTATLPKWIAWVSIVMGALCFTPAGIVTYVVQPLWFIAMAVILIRRQSAASGEKSVATTSPAVA